MNPRTDARRTLADHRADGEHAALGSWMSSATHLAMGWWRDEGLGWTRSASTPLDGAKEDAGRVGSNWPGDDSTVAGGGSGQCVELLWTIESAMAHDDALGGTFLKAAETLDELVDDETRRASIEAMVHSDKGATHRRRAFLAVNEAAARGESQLPDPQVVAELAQEQLDSDALRAKLDLTGCGGVVSFVGVTRETDEGHEVHRLEFDAWEAELVPALETLGRDACERFGVHAVAIAHRAGMVLPGEPIVAIHVAAPHRAEAFEACSWLIDELKAQAPLWKKEVRSDGEYWKHGLG